MTCSLSTLSTKTTTVPSPPRDPRKTVSPVRCISSRSAGRAISGQARWAGEAIPSSKAFELGMASPAHRAWPEIARPALRELMQRTGETVFLGSLGGDGTVVVFVDKVESEQVIRYTAGVGDRRALHATSSGKVILAFLPAPERERILRALPLKRYTDRTVTSLPALRAALAEVRQTGVCVNLDELAVGAAGIAAPIFDRDGHVAGACAIGGPTDRVRPRLKPLAAEVKATARAISALLGHRIDPPPASRKDQP